MRFANTNEAIDFGRKNRGNKDIIKELQVEYREIQQAWSELNCLLSNSKEDLQVLMDTAIEGQFLRESLEEISK